MRQPARPLILASTSRYRRELLGRFGLAFGVEPPGVDETPLDGEAPAALAERLAHQKAAAVARRFPHAVVVGSDQAAELDGRPVGKPGGHDAAVRQLLALQGRDLVFHTAVCVRCDETGFSRAVRVPVEVGFRPLARPEIERYLELERPYDCAGSARSEALGIVLMRYIRADDPTALVGLPLIETAALLRAAGIDPLVH